ncbi:MAG: hypothetical protein JST89_20585 [Cyanobacteria bacterium SZAS-4]|nr:hypothetical protein [Cyanobacteria bacterium SZAS-4]
MTLDTFGLELTNNSKVGWAFSLPRNKTCINATSICKGLCYGNGIRYQSDAQQSKRERNYRTAQFLLNKGGKALLAENLTMIIDSARPRDWLVSKATDSPCTVPWTLRIHDVGDFYSLDYTAAWIIAIKERPECSFWFYTRSFLDEPLLQLLTELASLPNCQGWLSADKHNHMMSVRAYVKSPETWKVALLQDNDLPSQVALSLKEKISPTNIINFPHHRGRYHVEPLKGITACPAVLGTYKLSTNQNAPRPCQQCKYCLP